MTNPDRPEMDAAKVVEVFLPSITDLRDNFSQAQQAETALFDEVRTVQVAHGRAQEQTSQIGKNLATAKDVARAALDATDDEPEEIFLAQALLETGSTTAARASLDHLQRLNEYLANDGKRKLIVLGGLSLQGAEADSDGTVGQVAQVAFVDLFSRYSGVWLDGRDGVDRLGFSAREVRQFPLREGALRHGRREQPDEQLLVPGAFGEIQFAHTPDEAEALIGDKTVPRRGRGNFIMGGGPIPTAVISGEGVWAFAELLGDKNHFLRTAIAAAMGNPNVSEALPEDSEDLRTDRANFLSYFRSHIEAIVYGDPKARDDKEAKASLIFAPAAQAFLEITKASLASEIARVVNRRTHVERGNLSLMVKANIAQANPMGVESLQADDALEYLVNRLEAAGPDLGGIDSEIYSQTLEKIQYHALAKYRDSLGNGWRNRGRRKEATQKIAEL